MSRAEFSKSVKLQAWQRSNGQCEQCTARLYPGKTEYHHGKECTFGGEAALENCVVLCGACHSEITRERAGVIAKSTRIRNRHIGIKRPSRFPGSKDSGLKKKLNGEVVRR